MSEKIPYSQLPNLILVDGVPSKNLGGISQTLYNLFENYPAEKLFALCDINQLNEIAVSSLKTNVVSSTYKSLQFKRKPFSFFNAYLKQIDLFIRELFEIFFINLESLPTTGVLFICTSNIEKLQIAKKIANRKKYQLVTYYMDDWMGENKLNWLIGNAQEYVSWSLNTASGRLMISEYLNEKLIERYKLPKKPTIIVHNPVDVINHSTNELTDKTNAIFKVAYAGSIWPMHKDALTMVAKAIENIYLAGNQKIEFDIYTKPQIWEINQSDFNYLGLSYKGFVDYDQLFECLRNYDLLIVASSFLKEHEKFTNSSVQTKITDYLNFQVSILSVGPSIGASNLFIQKWNCGFVWNENNEMTLENNIQCIISNPDLRKEKIGNGIRILNEKFSKKIVQPELYSFLQQFI